MDQLLTFLVVAIAFPLGVLALFYFVTPREATLLRSPKSTPAPLPEPSPEEISARWKEFGQELRARQNQSEQEAATAPAPAPVEQFINVPLIIIGTLLLVVAALFALSSLPVQVIICVALGIVAIVSAVIFAKARKGQWQHRESTEAAPVKSDVTDASSPQPIGPQTGLSTEAQAARQPMPVSAPQSVPQADWTPACDDAVAAIVGLKIPKREAIALVRQAAGTTSSEILRNALKIRGQRQGQIIHSVNGHAPDQNASTPVTQIPATQEQFRTDAVSALVMLGIPPQTATALIQQVQGNTTEELIRSALKALRRSAS